MGAASDFRGRAQGERAGSNGSQAGPTAAGRQSSGKGWREGRCCAWQLGPAQDVAGPGLGAGPSLRAQVHHLQDVPRFQGLGRAQAAFLLPTC